MKKILLMLAVYFILIHAEAQDWEKFGKYWYAGEAELTSYVLQQSRYGEVRDGQSVLIFVTEPFSKSEQVKLDNPGGSDEVTVMKLNFTKNFVTGIYPYSMMMSSFVPVSYDQHPDALKVTATSQEWCGHAFTQLNLDDDEYRFRQFSYFQTEGDRDLMLDNYWLEDELWQRIRINPQSLPRGTVKIFPGTLFIRLSHDEPRLLTAETQLLEVSGNRFSDTSHMKYSLRYPKRTLDIYFEKEFPFGILGWSEAYNGQETFAILNKSLKTPYWTQNASKDVVLRKELGLE